MVVLILTLAFSAKDTPNDLTLSILARGWRYAHGQAWVIYVFALQGYFDALDFMPSDYLKRNGRPNDAHSILGRLLKGFKGMPFEAMHRIMTRLSKGTFFQLHEDYVNASITYLLDMTLRHDPENHKSTTEFDSLWRATHLSAGLWKMTFKQVQERDFLDVAPSQSDTMLGTAQGYNNVMQRSGSERDRKHLVLAWIEAGVLETQERLLTMMSRRGVNRKGMTSMIGARLFSPFARDFRQAHPSSGSPFQFPRMLC